MIKERYKIAGGNLTLLVEGCPSSKKIETAQRAIETDEAEQVGFITTKEGLSKLEMMGDELCINGTIALASKLGGSGKLFASGINGEVKFSNRGYGFTEIEFNLPYQREGNVVLFDGIGYLVEDSLPTVESTLWELSKRYKKPAFGLARMIEDRLNPIVYVDLVGTCVVETACGSGSVAVNIIRGTNEIIQTRGNSIYVSRNGYRFTVSAEIAKIGDKR